MLPISRNKVLVYQLALTCLMLALAILSALNSSIEYDEAYNATVAKSLATGHGYATTYPTEKKFNAEISTGPALLLPQALLIRLIGNKHWIPGVVNSTLSILMLGCTFYLLARAAEGSARWKRVLASNAPLLFYSLCYAVGVIGYFTVGLGETSAFAAAVLGTFLMARSLQRTKHAPIYLLGGAWVLGLSIMFKYLALIYVLSALLVFILAAVRQKRAHPGGMALAFLLCALPTLLYVGALYAWGDLASTLAFFKTGGSGLNLLDHDAPAIVAALLSGASRNLEILSSALGGAANVAVYAGLILYALYRSTHFLFSSIGPAAAGGASESGPLKIVFGTLSVAVLAGSLWWVTMSPTGWIRHLLPFLLGAFLLAVAVCVLAGEKMSRAFSVALCFYCGIGVLTHEERFATHPRGYSYPAGTPREVMNIYNGLQLAPSHRLADQLKIVDYLDTLKASGAVTLFGCSWWANRDTEYLMRSSGNFKDCLEGDFLNEPNGARRLLVIDHTYWNWEGNKKTAAVEEFCRSNNKLAFASRSYSVYECPDSPQVSDQRTTGAARIAP